MDSTDLAFAGIARQAQLLRDRQITSVELVESYLGRIERINPQLNAFAAVFAERARAAAAAADERIAAGEAGEGAPLLGVPVAFKDELDIEGEIAQHGTSAYTEPARSDAAHWARLKAAGAILLAKTNLPELAICGFTETDAWGITRNPWDPSRTTGGSSGGSGAAVAAGLVGAASASDGAGSIRIPAANCGLFGLKPQRGRVSLAPLADHWLGMTSAGCLSRRVADTALWLDIASGPEPGDRHRPSAPERSYVTAATTEPGELKIGWSTKPPRAIAPPHLDDEVAGAVERVADTLGEIGHSVFEQDPDWGTVGNDFAVRYLKGIEGDYDEVPQPERLESRTRGFKRLARPIPDRLLRRALDREQAHARRINEIFQRCDLLMTPVTGTLAVEIGRWAGQGALRTLIGMSRVYPYTAVWNYLGQPAASIPAGSSAGGLPLSVQLIAPPGREDLLLTVATQLEDALGWPEHRPPLAAAG